MAAINTWTGHAYSGSDDLPVARVARSTTPDDVRDGIDLDGRDAVRELARPVIDNGYDTL
jgi:hypothetical protein